MKFLFIFGDWFAKLLFIMFFPELTRCEDTLFILLKHFFTFLLILIIFTEI